MNETISLNSGPIKVSLITLSLGASIDQQTSSMSIFDIIDDIRIPKIPVQLSSLVITLSLEKVDPKEFSGRMLIHFLTPDGNQHKVGNGEMRIPAQQKRMKAAFRFSHFPIQAFGSHRFVLSWIDEQNIKVGEAILDFQVIQTIEKPMESENRGDQLMPH